MGFVRDDGSLDLTRYIQLELLAVVFCAVLAASALIGDGSAAEAIIWGSLGLVPAFLAWRTSEMRATVAKFRTQWVAGHAPVRATRVARKRGLSGWFRRMIVVVATDDILVLAKARFRPPVAVAEATFDDLTAFFWGGGHMAGKLTISTSEWCTQLDAAVASEISVVKAVLGRRRPALVCEASRPLE
ncbi:MAG: hypothetical protein ACRDKI_01255 [Solirubrobacterales bacterium]